MKNSGTLVSGGGTNGSEPQKHPYDERVQISIGGKRRKAIEQTHKRAQKKRKRSTTVILKELKTKFKSARKEIDSLKEIMESKEKEMKKLKRRYKNLKLRYAGLRRGYGVQSDRIEDAEHQLTNIHFRDLMALLFRRGSRSESNIRGLGGTTASL